MKIKRRSGVNGRSFSKLLKNIKRSIIRGLHHAGDFFKRIFSVVGSFITGLSSKVKIIAAAALGVIVVGVVILIIAVGGSPASSKDVDPGVSSIPVATAKPVDDFGSLTEEQKESVVEEDSVPERKDDPPQDVYKYGDDHTEVKKIQERLMELGYMGEDEPTYYFGPTTMNSIIAFQKKCNMTEDGIVGKETYDKLFSGDAPYYSVAEGAEGPDVRNLQERLVELGFLDKATGYFGTTTTAAVIKLQSKNGLAADGSIGRMTRELLYSDNVKANVMGAGDEGEMVKKYQQKLKDLAYLMTTVDGKYGQGTVEAVKLFQEDNGLVADGYLGAKTRELLDSEQVLANVLKNGDKSTMVSKVQKYLKDLGYLSSSATGYFGDETEKAVKTFQAKNGLSADGKVGANTLRVLSSGQAVNASGGRGSTSSGINRFINVAMSKLGSRYILGAKGPSQFDCSGFVYWCLNQSGVSQGYMTSYYWQHTSRYKRISSMSSLRRGDVISYRGHVAICAGNGYMIDASSRNGKVVYRSYQSPYWYSHFVCGYRIFG